jgi:O-antigen/teichoic acid export membrane protein
VSVVESNAMIQSNSQRAGALLYFQIVILISSLVVGVLSARLLGAYGRGVYAVAFVAPQLLSSLLASGFSESTIYTVSRGRDRAEHVLRVLLFVSLSGSILGAILLAGLYFPLRGSLLKGVDASVFLAASLSLPPLTWMTLGQAYLFGRGRTVASQLPAVFERIGTLIGIVVASMLGFGVFGFVAFTSGGALCGAIITSLAIGHRDLLLAVSHRGVTKLGRQMAGFAGAVFVANFAQKLTYRLDQLIVNAVAGPATVGVYALAARLAEMPLLAPRALRVTWVAARAREGEIQDSVPATLAGGRKLILLMGVLLPVYGVIAAPLIPLVYGSDFRPSVVPFLLLLLATLLLSASFPFVSGLTGGGRPKRLAIGATCGMIATVMLDLALVPSLGSIGASLASVGAYAIFTVIVFTQWRGQAPGLPISVSDLLPRATDARELIASLGRASRLTTPAALRSQVGRQP